ncbi:MAG: GTPase domain-containing protein [bacterium]|nr:GTPase domain-containing protein [bacterium]
MAEIRNDQGEINARIAYWGVAGAGISANLAMIHSKLKENNRGELQRVPTRIDPTVEYEVLPIELGKVNGVRTRVHVIGVPAAPEQAPTRKQLLDRIDGVVFVADSRPECMAENIASLSELITFLDDYGHDPADLPFVVQYNKCDLVDPFVIERLHGEIRVPGAAVYEASAKDGTGVLKTLTTISKQVIRHLGRREEREQVPPKPAPAVLPQAAPQVEAVPLAPAPEPVPSPPSFEPEVPAQPMAALVMAEPETTSSTLSLMESAILAEAADDAEAQAVSAVTQDAQALLDRPFDALVHETKPNDGARIGADLRIVSVGDATRKDNRSLQVPLVLGNDDGETVTLALTIALDPLLDGDT